MSVNLCNSLYGVTVSSSSVCSEGYGPENLLESGRKPAGRTGFMAERFIKPPVEVVFAFPIKVEVKDVFIDPKVGNQKSCGFEILTASSATSNPKNEGPDDIIEPREILFQTIGKSPWRSENIALFHFVNRRYCPKLKVDLSNLSHNNWTCGASDEGQNFSLRHQVSKFLLEITHLKIRIFRTFSGSIPCLRRVTINGQPSYACKKHEIDEFSSKVRNLFMKEEVVSSRNVQVEKQTFVREESGLHGHSSSQDDITFPEEFKDALTFDLMPMPVILPSGHTIDQTTLDKHIAAEAKWGRPPCDPFTGLVFTNAAKPLPNLLLKARVDKFLLKSGRKFEHLPRRTIGISASPAPEKGIPETGIRIDSRQGKNTSDSDLQISSSRGHEESTTNVTRKGPSRGSRAAKRTAPKRKLKGADVTSGPIPTTRRRIKAAPSSQESASHEAVVRDSLTDALNSTLAQLPSFGKERTVVPQRKRLACIQCTGDSTGSANGTPRHLYRCPCDHIYCRTCLTGCRSSDSSHNNSKHSCVACGSEFDSKDVMRIHDATMMPS